MAYPFALVLHTHLPMVVNHGRWPHGSDWLNEASVRVLPAAARDGPPPGRRRHLAEVDDQSLAGARRAARLARVPEGARLLLRQRPARVRGQPRALPARGPAGASRGSPTSGKSSTSACGSCTGASAATFRAPSPSCSATATWRSSPARPPTATCRCSPATSRSICSCGPPSRPTGGTSAQAPRGIWLPECAYRPRYEWTPPTGPRPGARAADAARPRGDAGRARPRVLRGRLAPGGGRRAVFPLPRLRPPAQRARRDPPLSSR